MRSVFIISDLMDFVNIFIKKTINYTPYAIKMIYFENTHRVRIKTVKKIRSYRICSNRVFFMVY